MNHSISIIALSPRLIICPDDIVRLKGESNYSRIFFSDGRNVVVSQNLGMIAQKLSSEFVRVHKSHLVNVRYVAGLLRRQKAMILTTGCRIPVSRRRKSMVLNSEFIIINTSFDKVQIPMLPAFELY